MAKDLPIIGLVEEVEVIGRNKTATVRALVDTGAQWNSIDEKLAEELDLGPEIGTRRIRAASTKKRSIRSVVKADVKIMGKIFHAEINLQDRSHMKFPMLIGRNILSGNFIVDPQKNISLFRKGLDK